jgi:hypothetical protein
MQQFFCMYIWTIRCVRIIYEKSIFCVVDVKKTKHVLQKLLFLVPNFILLHIPNDKSIFYEKLFTHSACADVHVNFSFEFFKYFKMYKRHISKKRIIWIKSQNYHSYLSDTFLEIPRTYHYHIMPVGVKVHTSTVELGDILLHACSHFSKPVQSQAINISSYFQLSNLHV